MRFETGVHGVNGRTDRQAMGGAAALLAALLLAGAALGALAETPLEKTAQRTSFNVGLRILDFTFERPDGVPETLTVAVWYPTTAEPRLFLRVEARSYASSFCWPRARRRQTGSRSSSPYGPAENGRN